MAGLPLIHEESYTNSNKVKHLRELLKLLSIKRKLYLKKKLILEAVNQTCTDEDKHSDEEIVSGSITTKKLNEEYCVLEKSNSIRLLGVVSDNDTLTLRGGNVLAMQADINLKKKLKNLRLNFSTACNCDIEKVMRTPRVTEKVLISFLLNLRESQQELLNNLSKVLLILEEILNIRLHEVPDVCKMIKKQYVTSSRLQCFKLQIGKGKIEEMFWMQLPEFLNAFKTFYNEIKDKKQEHFIVLQNLKAREASYKFVDCAQYQNILKLYLQYKHSVTSKKKNLSSIIQ